MIATKKPPISSWSIWDHKTGELCQFLFSDTQTDPEYVLSEPYKKEGLRSVLSGALA
jgi:hypothetical protein